MKKRTSFRILTGLLCLCMALSACRQVQPGETTNETTLPVQDTTVSDVTYSIQVQTEEGTVLEQLGIYVYADSSLKELVWYDTTDANGSITFTGAPGAAYVAVLDNVPEEYAAEEYYVLTGENTRIILLPVEDTQLDLSEITYSLGDVMQDFSVTDPEGNVYTLSELLADKKAVVLNFFYNECQPCMDEFPFLQEAYVQYSEDVALLAMNPMDTDPAAIAQLQQTLGVSFPMVPCSPDWASAMQLQGYPTTVVVDRFGVISLIHRSAVPDAKTFKDTFAFFTAEDYVQTTVEDINTLVTDEPDNPLDINGMTSFELTLRPGETLTYQVYKINDMILQFKGEGGQVTYNGKTYDAKNGTVSLSVSTPDNYTPVELSFSNTSAETVTYTGSFLFKAGSWNSPYSLTLGEFTTKIAAGNDKGVHYRYRASESGVLTLECLSVTAGVEYACTLYNLTSGAYITMDADGVIVDGGNKSVSVKVSKGDSVMVILSTVPDENYSYPAATFVSNASFVASDEEDKEDETVKAVYSVTVADNHGTPMAGVPMKVEGESVSEVWTTDEAGKAEKELPVGSYSVTVTVPAGYTAQQTQFALTEETVSVQVVLEEVVITNADYTVTVLDPQGMPLEGIMVILGDTFAATDAEGRVSANLVLDIYTVYISGQPANMVMDSPFYTLSKELTELTVTLSYKPGSEQAPIAVDALPLDTVTLGAGEGVYYILPLEEGMLLTVRDSDAYITYNGVTYGAVNGVVSVEVEATEDACVIIGNGGAEAESYSVQLLPPLGTEGNPIVLTSLEQLNVVLQSGNEGVYYVWTAPDNGKVTFTIESLTEDVRGKLVVSNTVTGEQISVSSPVPEETVPEETVPEETVPEETVPEETVPEETVPEETVPEETVPEETVPEETVPEETVPEETVPEETVPEETVPEETVPEETVPEETVPEETVPEETVPEETVPEETVPEETVPEETVPEETVPEETVPEETVPEETVPEETVPEETVPEETVPEETVPEETVPEETVPEETVPEETVPEETVPEETVPEETVPEETVPEETVPEETVPEETVPEETAPEETVPEETVPEETVPEEEPVKTDITVAKGDVLLIYVAAEADENGNTPAAELVVSAVYETEGSEDPDDPQDPTDPEESKMASYTVTVTDYDKNPAAAMMTAIYDETGALVTTAATDTNGQVTLQMERGNYTVALLGTDRYYEKTTAKLTASQTELLILLAQEPDESKVEYLSYCDGETAYVLGEGGTHVLVGSGQVGYSTELGVTLYVFTPERAGIYRFTTSNPEAKISYWNAPFFIYNATANLTDYADNAFTRTVQEGNLGGSFVIGISGAEECALVVTWQGEPGFDPNYVPYTVYEGSWEPKSFSYSGAALNDVDVVNGKAEDYVLVYNETDGYYHLGELNGPVMYARLSGTGLKVSLDTMINGDGVAGGAAFRCVYYDSYGNLCKEDYTDLMVKYIDAMGTNTTVYPLTKDLHYMLNMGITGSGWTDPDNPSYLFTDQTLNQEIAWMFLLCY